MATALIGPGGFIEKNLDAQAHFDHRYRSLEEARGKAFALLVCAGAPGTKWQANRDPEADLAAVKQLIAALGEVQAERLVLLSTVDVYPRPEAVDEDTPIDAAAGTPFGRHRRALEDFCRERFPATVLRLPLLFGPGLEKNVLFDLINDHQVERIHPDSAFQYYAVEHLWRDALIAVEKGIPVLNLACEPIPTRELALRCFGRELSTYPGTSPVQYDVGSKHAPLWGGRDYLYSKERVLHEIGDFLEKERAL